MATAHRLVRTSLADTATIVVFAAALLVSPAAGGALGGIRGGLAALVIAALSVTYGRATGRLLHLDPRAGFAASFEAVAGFLASACPSGRNRGPNSMPLLLCIDVIVVAALVGATRRLHQLRWATVAAPGSSSKALELVVLIACAALVGYWSRASLAVVSTPRDTALFNAWPISCCAVGITYLRDYPRLVWSARSEWVFSTALPSREFTMPALYSELSGCHCSKWRRPSGSTASFSARATYVFGSALGGPGRRGRSRHGLSPAGCLHLGFQNQFLSFHWLLQIAGGSAMPSP